MSTAGPAFKYYALKPLANSLINSTIQIKQYEPGKGLTTPTVMAFTDIDMELWATDFIRAVEQFIRVFSPTTGNPDTDADLARVLVAKTVLCKAIPAGIAAIYNDNSEVGQIKNAIVAMQKALSVGLSHAYNVTAILASTEDAILYWEGDPLPIPVTDIPVILRTFPPMPVLTNHEITATYPDADDVLKAKLVSYAISFNHNSAVLDSICFNINPNAVAANSTKTADDLFNNLAQFMSVYPALQNDLYEQKEESAIAEEIFRIAIKTFADITTSVATAWADHWLPLQGSDNSPLEFAFNVSKNYLINDPEYIDTVTVTIKDLNWPYIPLLFAVDINGDYQQLAYKPVANGQYLFEYKAQEKSSGQNLKIVFPGIDLFSFVSLTTSAYVARNNFGKINPVFIRKTGTVSFAEPVFPIINNATPIILNNEAPRLDSLIAFFTQLFAATAFVHEIGVNISYVIPRSGEMSPPKIPVLAAPLTLYSKELMISINDQLTNWLRERAPENAAYFTMTLNVFNSLNMPVFVLEDILTLEDIRFN